MQDITEELLTNDVIQTRKILTECVNLLANTPQQEKYRKFLAEFREIDEQYIHSLKCFYVEHKSEIIEALSVNYLNENLGFVQDKDNVFRERFVIPVWDIRGQVAGLVGYDNLSDYKYLLSKTLGFSRKNIVFGLEDYEFILEQDYCIIVEGIFDKIRLKSLGFPCLALQGTYIPKVVYSMLGRLKGVIAIPDNDTAGISTQPYWKNINKNMSFIRITPQKDIDLFLKKKDNIKNFRTCVDDILTEWQLNLYQTKILESL